MAGFQHGREQLEDMREAEGAEINRLINDARESFDDMMEAIKEKKKMQHTKCEDHAKAIPGKVKDLADKLVHAHGLAGVRSEDKELFDWCDGVGTDAMTDHVMQLLRLHARPDDVPGMVRTLKEAANQLPSTPQLRCRLKEAINDLWNTVDRPTPWLSGHPTLARQQSTYK